MYVHRTPNLLVHLHTGCSGGWTELCCIKQKKVIKVIYLIVYYYFSVVLIFYYFFLYIFVYLFSLYHLAFVCKPFVQILARRSISYIFNELWMINVFLVQKRSRVENDLEANFSQVFFLLFRGEVPLWTCIHVLHALTHSSHSRV